MSKILVTLEINLWEGPEVHIKSKKVERETEKALFVPTMRYVHNRTSPIYSIGPFNKCHLNEVTSARPGLARCHFVLEGDLAHSQVRKTPEYRSMVTRMLDEMHADLITAGTHIAQLEDGL